MNNTGMMGRVYCVWWVDDGLSLYVLRSACPSRAGQWPDVPAGPSTGREERRVFDRINRMGAKYMVYGGLCMVEEKKMLIGQIGQIV